MASAKYRLSASLHWHRSAGESRKKAGPGRQRRNFCGQKRIAGFDESFREHIDSNDEDKALEMKGNKEDPQSAGPVPPPVLRSC